jgi:16S rRNA (cytosine1402-N4)-methyltransferase
MIAWAAPIAPDEIMSSRRPAKRGEAPGAEGGGYHVPVLVEEVMACLEPGPGKVILDGTLGGGGHAERMLEAGARVIGLDQDPEAVAYARERLAGYGGRFEAVQINFRRAGEVLDALKVPAVDGVLLDLGVSSHQFDEPRRGFSIQGDGPLDMRMNPESGVTAGELVNGLAEEELAALFREYGEEPMARRIARRIVAERAKGALSGTAQLAACVEAAVGRRGRVHPATRVFQALRIAVNRELEVLEAALGTLVRRLAPGGRIAVIAFHSLEDRIVKQYFRHASAETLDRPEWPAPRPNPDHLLRLVGRGPVEAGEAELEANPRARSAKLRCAERVGA